MRGSCEDPNATPSPEPITNLRTVPTLAPITFLCAEANPASLCGSFLHRVVRINSELVRGMSGLDASRFWEELIRIRIRAVRAVRVGISVRVRLRVRVGITLGIGFAIGLRSITLLHFTRPSAVLNLQPQP